VASLMENLIAVLQQECVEYNGLLELSGRKTPIIVAGDLNNLEKITDEEQLIVSRINHLDTIRNEAVQDIANVLNKDVTKLKIADLIKMLEQRPEEQQKLAAASDALQSVVRNVARVNGQNRELIQNALEMVQFNMNLIQSMKAAPETANYNRGAYNTGDIIGIERKSFDAKQ